MSNPFEDMFGKPKRSNLHLHTTTVTHWDAHQFNQRLNDELERITGSPRDGSYNRSVQVQYSTCTKGDGMQYSALVVEEWMTDLPDDQDEDEDDEPRQTEGPMIHPMSLMMGRQVD